MANDSLLKKNIYLIFASDNNYVHHLAVVIASVLSNLSGSYLLHIYILDDGITEENKNKLKSLKQIRSFVIKFIPIDCDQYNFFKGNRSQYISRATYARFQLSRLLPDLDRCIYLDCDLVVRKDLSQLWEVELGDNVLGAVEDPCGAQVLLALGIPQQAGYFNAGVLLLDLKKMCEFGLEQKGLRMLKENHDLVYGDQDVLNLLFHGQWYPLDVKWNATSNMYLLKGLTKYARYKAPEVNTGLKDPAIIHFTQPKKGDSFLCQHPFCRDYRKYLKITPWRDHSRKDVNLRNIFVHFAWFLKNLVRKVPFVFLFIRNLKRKYTGFEGSLLSQDKRSKRGERR